jgi:hypothetical protein
VVLLVLAGGVGGGLWWLVSYIRSEQSGKDGTERVRANDDGARQLPPDYTASFENWAQDIEKAKEQAAARKKDLLLFFAGSDETDGDSFRFQGIYQHDPQIAARIQRDLVPVYLDFPIHQAGRDKVQSAERNEKAKADYQVITYPTFLLADAQGKPYARFGYVPNGGGEVYMEVLDTLKKARGERDKLLAALDKAEGLDRAKAAAKAVEHLADHEVIQYYGPLLKEAGELAQKHDPKNEHSILETVFVAEWTMKLETLRLASAPERAQHAVQVLEWGREKRFKDADRAARLCLQAGEELGKVLKKRECIQALRQGLAYHPKDEGVRQHLQLRMAMLGLSTGTGFAVSPGGYILTNHHVASEGGTLDVRVPNSDEYLPAKVVAQDKDKDMALLRVELPKGKELVPLPLATRPLRRGEKVAALGYPLGDAVGSGIKLTTGVVSALPEAANHGMLVLDAKVNPGNSGGPLCDKAGNVVAMVTAKSLASGAIESYSMARPAADLDAFLRAHLPEHKPCEVRAKDHEWDEVDSMVSPSVLMVIRMPQ